jgi:uncharacterized protein
LDIDRIEAVALAEMAKRQDLSFREPGWTLYHGKRTGRIACYLRERLDLSVDADALYVAGLFHDVRKDQEPHAELGAKRIRELLSGLVPQESLFTICEAVSLHNKRKQSDSFSDFTKLLQDADLIDHVGFIDIWMSFYWSGNKNESITDHLKFYKGENRKQTQEYMITHLNFDVSLEMLEERIKKSEQFFGEFQRVYIEGV